MLDFWNRGIDWFLIEGCILGIALIWLIIKQIILDLVKWIDFIDFIDYETGLFGEFVDLAS